MKTVFSFPFPPEIGMEEEEYLAFVAEDSDGSRRIVREIGGGIYTIPVEHLKKKLIEYEEAIAMTQTAMALLRR